jgi:hypothetical protein
LHRLCHGARGMRLHARGRSERGFTIRDVAQRGPNQPLAPSEGDGDARLPRREDQRKGSAWGLLAGPAYRRAARAPTAAEARKDETRKPAVGFPGKAGSKPRTGNGAARGFTATHDCWIGHRKSDPACRAFMTQVRTPVNCNRQTRPSGRRMARSRSGTRVGTCLVRAAPPGSGGTEPITSQWADATGGNILRRTGPRNPPSPPSGPNQNSWA